MGPTYYTPYDFYFEGVSVDIADIPEDKTDNASDMQLQIYDLQGRPVQQPDRGIYIKNGKKIYIK